MKISTNSYINVLTLCSLLLFSCKKDFLEAIPDKSLAVPTTLTEFQALIDAQATYDVHPALADISCDDYYVSYTTFQSKFYLLQNTYTWGANTYSGGSGLGISDWKNPYNNIFIANIVLEGLEKITITNVEKQNFDAIKGSALFIRAFNLYNLAQLFSEPYVPSSAETDLGLPLRISSDFNKKIDRASVKETYTQINQDLIMAKDLLPATVPTANYINRPSKPAVFALLARSYLSMQNYTAASKYADSCLLLYDTLWNYNEIDGTPALIFRKNPEEIMRATQLSYAMTNFAPTALIDSTLYNSYDPNDLRRSLYFKNNADGTAWFRGNYSGDANEFIGMATDELYLIRSECKARSGNLAGAMSDLNALLIKRWKKGTFVPYTAVDENEALSKILKERRKELLQRGIRWTDLRRLNQDTRFSVTLKRILNGQTYILPPNDHRYTLLIPVDEMQLTNVTQNKR
jgi:hypothetical protein